MKILILEIIYEEIERKAWVKERGGCSNCGSVYTVGLGRENLVPVRGFVVRLSHSDESEDCPNH